MCHFHIRNNSSVYRASCNGNSAAMRADGTPLCHNADAAAGPAYVAARPPAQPGPAICVPHFLLVMQTDRQSNRLIIIIKIQFSRQHTLSAASSDVTSFFSSVGSSSTCASFLLPFSDRLRSSCVSGCQTDDKLSLDKTTYR